MTKKTWKTAEEYLAEKAADKSHIEMWRAKDEELKRRKDELTEAEAPLVEALRSAGQPVSSVWDLVNTASAYPAAIPVLFEHLHRPYPERIAEGILRALAVPESRSRWKELRAVFEASPAQKNGGLRWAAACALGSAADDGVVAEVMQIVRDPIYGFDRAPLLPVLARSSDPQAKMLLHELRADPVLGKEVKKMRRIRKAEMKSPDGVVDSP